VAAVKPITIVGGGLAGLTLGLGLRQQGIPVTVWEAGRYPRHRVCGEFISGAGVAVLARLGLLEILRQAGAVPARTSAFFLGGAASPLRPLPTPALCLSRHALDALVADQFRQAGGDLRENARWPEREFGDGVVRASGRRRHLRGNGVGWFGLKVHARDVPLAADLEMHGTQSGYVGLCRLKDGEVNICGLFRTHAANARPEGAPAGCGLGSANPHQRAPSKRSARQSFRELSVPGTPLSQRLESAVFDETSFCSVAGISLRPCHAASQSECRIGDALTMIPPITGNGMSMAFEAAELAIGPLAAYSRSETSWETARLAVGAACDQTFARRLAWARWLQWMTFTPILRYRLGSVVLRSGLLWHTIFTRTR